MGIRLEKIVGNLQVAYTKVRPGTLYHCDALMKRYVMDSQSSVYDRMIQGCYTADGQIYFLRGKEKIPFLALTREPENLVLRHINDSVNNAFNALVHKGNYHPEPKEAKKAIRARDTVIIDLTKLSLSGDTAGGYYLKITSTNYPLLNQEEQKLAERFYGPMLLKTLEKTDAIYIYVLHPLYVKKCALKHPIARVSMLYSSSVLSMVYTLGRGAFTYGHMRGARRQSL